MQDCIIDKSLIDLNVVSIISQLEEENFIACIVSTAVRELLEGVEPTSYRIATNATVSQIRRIFKRCMYSTLDEASLTVIMNMNAYEIISVSNVGDDVYHSIANVVFAKSECSADMLIYDFKKGIVDYYNALSDVQNRIIAKRSNVYFTKSPLSMLKLITLATIYNYDIDKDTREEIIMCAPYAHRIPHSKVLEEINKILMSEHPEKFIMLHELNVLKYILPEIENCFGVRQRNKFHIYDVGNHIIKAVESTPTDFVLRWAALLHDCGKPKCSSCDNDGIIHFYGHHKESVRIGNNILHLLGMEEGIISDILLLVEYHDVRIEPTYPSVKRILSRMGETLFEKLILLQKADSSAKNLKYVREKHEKLDRLFAIYTSILSEGQPYKMSELLISSRDLMKLHYRAGHEIGDTLRVLLDEVIMNPSLNNRDYLLHRAKELKNKRDYSIKRRKDVRT